MLCIHWKFVAFGCFRLFVLRIRLSQNEKAKMKWPMIVVPKLKRKFNAHVYIEIHNNDNFKENYNDSKTWL